MATVPNKDGLGPADPHIGPDHQPDNNYRVAAALNSDNAVVITPMRTFLHVVNAVNNAAAVRFIKLYDQATLPTSADTPKITIELPAGQGIAIDEKGLRFNTGLGIRMVTGSADNDNTAVTAGDISGLNITYE